MLQAIAEDTRTRCLCGQATVKAVEAAERSSRRAERAFEAAVKAGAAW